MWRFPYRRRPDRALNRAMHIAMLVAGVAACLSGLARTAQAQDEQVSRTGQADHPILISEHAGWSSDCDAIAPPTLYLYEPPRHGSVCTRVATIKIRAMYVGTESQCIGRLVRGIRFIYHPDQGYTGGDGLRYAAQYPLALRTVSVDVTVTAQPPAAPTAAPTGIVAPPSSQSSTPVPACDELVF
jgi:hypothetical protein